MVGQGVGKLRRTDDRGHRERAIVAARGHARDHHRLAHQRNCSRQAVVIVTELDDQLAAVMDELRFGMAGIWATVLPTDAFRICNASAAVSCPELLGSPIHDRIEVGIGVEAAAQSSRILQNDEGLPGH